MEFISTREMNEDDMNFGNTNLNEDLTVTVVIAF